VWLLAVLAVIFYYAFSSSLRVRLKSLAMSQENYLRPVDALNKETIGLIKNNVQVQ
jgi:hypothetical protein